MANKQTEKVGGKKNIHVFMKTSYNTRNLNSQNMQNNLFTNSKIKVRTAQGLKQKSQLLFYYKFYFEYLKTKQPAVTTDEIYHLFN